MTTSSPWQRSPLRSTSAPTSSTTGSNAITCERDAGPGGRWFIDFDADAEAACRKWIATSVQLTSPSVCKPTFLAADTVAALTYVPLNPDYPRPVARATDLVQGQTSASPVGHGEQVGTELLGHSGPAAVAELLEDGEVGRVPLHEQISGSIEKGGPPRVASEGGHVREMRERVPDRPGLLCVALVLQYHDRCSDREAAERAAYDQRWKVALETRELEGRQLSRPAPNRA